MCTNYYLKVPMKDTTALSFEIMSTMTSFALTTLAYR